MTTNITRRLFSAASAAAIASVLLAGCTGSGNGPDAARTPATAEPTATTQQVTPDYWNARVIDVLSGDTLRVQLTEGYVYKTNPGNTRGEDYTFPAEPKTLTVKDATYDAPVKGECGFEESRVNLIQRGFLVQSDVTPDWAPSEEDRLFVSLQRSGEEFDSIPQVDDQGRELYYLNSLPLSLAQVQLQDGYGRVSTLLPQGSLHAARTNTEQDGKDAAENGKNLWATCWK